MMIGTVVSCWYRMYVQVFLFASLLLLNAWKVEHVGAQFFQEIVESRPPSVDFVATHFGSGDLEYDSTSGTIVITASSDDSMAGDAGAVYVVTESTLGAMDWASQPQQKLVAYDAIACDEYGYSASIQTGGELIAVSAPFRGRFFNPTYCNGGDAMGVVYVHYESVPGAKDWDQQPGIRIDGADWCNHPNGCLFGYSVLVQDNKVLVTNLRNLTIDIFQETTPGARDWGVPGTLFRSIKSPPDDNSAGGSYLSFGSDLESDDSTVVIGCKDWGLDTGGGSIIAYGMIFISTETVQGAWDYASVPTISIHPRFHDDAVTVVNFPDHFSIKGRHIVAGHTTYNEFYSLGGIVFIYQESVLGAKDWQDWEIRLFPAIMFANAHQFGRYVDVSDDGNRLFVSAMKSQASYDAYGLVNPGIFYVFELMVPGESDWEQPYFEREWFPVRQDWDEIGSQFIIHDNLLVSNGVRRLSRNNTVFVAIVCPEGWTGIACDVDIDDCASSPCFNNAVCTDGGRHNYTCDCSGTAYEGSQCDILIDDCASSPCLNNGTCTDAGKQLYSCNCTGTGYSGTTCEEIIDVCESSPCLNGGTCTLEGPHMFSCACGSFGFQGDVCQIDVDDCASSPCVNDGTCTDMGPNEYECDCTASFDGTRCQHDLPDCGSSPCLQEGSCIEGVGASFTCECVDGATGAQCETNIDDCLSSPCLNGGVCIDDATQLMEFLCICTATGATGKYCQKDGDDCVSSPCLNGGVCEDAGIRNFTCACDEALTYGDLCENFVPDPCLSSPCNVDESCKWKPNKGLMTCTATDHCLSFPCDGGELCTSVTGGYECSSGGGNPDVDDNKICVNVFVPSERIESSENAFLGEVQMLLINQGLNGSRVEFTLFVTGGRILVACADPPVLAFDLLTALLSLALEEPAVENYLPSVWTSSDACDTCVEIEISFDLAENVTFEVFLYSLQENFADSIGGSADDVTILEIVAPSDVSTEWTLLPRTNGETYGVTFVYQNREDLSAEVIVAAVEDSDGPIATNMRNPTTDVRIVNEAQQQANDDDDDGGNVTEDNTTYYLILGMLAVLLLCAILYYFFFSKNTEKRKRVLAMPV